MLYLVVAAVLLAAVYGVMAFYLNYMYSKKFSL
jgi:hypothetical protein